METSSPCVKTKSSLAFSVLSIFKVVSFCCVIISFQLFSFPFIDTGWSFCCLIGFFLARFTMFIWTSLLLLFFLFQSVVSYDFFMVILSPLVVRYSSVDFCSRSKVKGFPLIGIVDKFQFCWTYSAGYCTSSLDSRLVSSEENFVLG